jgi:hypothetical protein
MAYLTAEVKDLKRSFIRAVVVPGIAIGYFVFSIIFFIFVSSRHFPHRDAIIFGNIFFAVFVVFIALIIFLSASQLTQKSEGGSSDQIPSEAEKMEDSAEDRAMKAFTDKSVDHLIWLINKDKERDEEIEALQKELLELQNTHYVSADLDEVNQS